MKETMKWSKKQKNGETNGQKIISTTTQETKDRETWIHTLKPRMNSKTNSTCNTIDKNVDIKLSAHDTFLE